MTGGDNQGTRLNLTQEDGDMARQRTRQSGVHYIQKHKRQKTNDPRQEMTKQMTDSHTNISWREKTTMETRLGSRRE